MAPAFTLRLFGTPRIETFVGPAPAFGSQPLALLAVLACAGGAGDAPGQGARPLLA